MARSLGLTAYRALARRNDAPTAQALPARPSGELVWLHAGERENLLALQDLARRFASVRDGLKVLITLPDAETSDLPNAEAPITYGVTPGEHPSSVQTFLRHWKPNACVWAWGGLRPNLVMETAAIGCPLMLIDADVEGFEARRDKWMPVLTRELLGQFQAVFTRSEDGYRRLLHLGLEPSAVRRTSFLMAGGQVLTCADSDLDEISAAMGGRPAWFACDVTEQELPLVLSAHQQALRLSHRLVLILQSQVAPAQVASLAAERNLTAAYWDEGQYPDDTTQLLISEDVAERGLFYRVAPVSFLGGTLFASDRHRDPMEAAALGSAILYGPRVRHYMPSYTRLAGAGAARIVNDADALGTAVSRLIAPDQAATMAHAGWDVVSEGAALTDRIVDLVQDTLDRGLRKA